MTDRARDRRVDDESAQSFPASDPPSFTPVQGPDGKRRDGERPHPNPDEVAHRRTQKAEEAERARDPHGVRPAGTADEDEPAGSPSSDRHRTETTINRVRK